MRHWRLFVLVMVFVYYLFSLALVILPLAFSNQYTEISDQYQDMPPLERLAGTLLPAILLLFAIIVGLCFLAFERLKTGLTICMLFGGIWLALQISIAEGVNLFRPLTEILLLLICLLTFRTKNRQTPIDLELSED